MKLWIALVIVIGSWFWYKKANGRIALGTETIQSHRGDPCHGKRACVIVYVAPWCGACAAAKSLVLALANRWKEPDAAEPYGLRVVVGGDTEENSEAYAKGYGTYAIFDKGEKYRRDYSIQAFPTWVVLNGKGEKVLNYSGGVRVSSLEDFITDYLKLAARK